MLRVENLTKTYRKVIANDNVSFSVPAACISLLVGPNGAGKTTLIKSVMGLLRYKGFISVNGFLNSSLEAKARLGYVPDEPNLYPLLTVAEHLEFTARLYKVTDWEHKAEKLLKRFELDDKRDKFASELSKGMQQKVSISCSLLPEPSVLLFDEPMIGLDPYAIKELKQVFLEERARGATLLISTHILDSVDTFWDQVMVMREGRLIAVETRLNLDSRGSSLEDFFFSITDADGDIHIRSEDRILPSSTEMADNER